MMKLLRRCLVAVSTLFAVSAMLVAPAAAQEEKEDKPFFSVNGHFGLYSDYRFRGVSLSDQDVAAQGSLVISKSGFYVGAWASNEDFLVGSDIEIDFFGGYTHAINDNFSVNLEGKWVTFPGCDCSFFRISPALLGNVAGYNWSAHFDYEPAQDDTLLGGEDNFYVYGTFGGPVPFSNPWGISFDTKLGYQEGAFVPEGRLDWLIGVNIPLNFLDGLVLSAQYIDTDSNSFDDPTIIGDEFNPNFGATGVVSISKSF